MDCSDSMKSSDSPYKLLVKAASLIPISHYLLFFFSLFLLFLYNILEFHFLQDFFSGFRGQPVCLTFNSCSKVYQEVASKCQLLHGRYLATPWLSSPHLQTVFLFLLSKPPLFSYRRQLFRMSDGGTIALDWLMSSDVLEKDFQVNGTHKDDKVPVVIVVPGLTNDSASPYITHFAFEMAKHGWNVVVSNHRGFGGILLTSDCFCTAGRTEDLREVVNYLHCQYPEAPLFAVGTSIGANLLVKYLGEDGVNVPVAGAAAICNPWDLLSRSIRDFNNYSARIAGNFETTDSFYRWCSSGRLVGNVMVPLLCISAIDDPVCTKEAIPWDECRRNKNIVPAITSHGGHIAFFEGITAKSLWWVRVVEEFLSVLHSSPLICKKEGQQH